MELTEIQQITSKIKANVNQVVVGQENTIDLLLVAMISSGHVLLEDVPGTGKTLMAKSLAKSLAGNFKRIQFTPDLLPTDITGIHFYSQQKGEFEFRPGPIFTNILLADEINRATPRTQSSLLESMEERQVTIDGNTHTLAKPFLVIATQNPIESQGTFPLPEAQLDRFLLKINMGYPSREEGLEILKRFKAENPLEALQSIITVDDIVKMQQIYSDVDISEDVLGYLIDVVEQTRDHDSVALGVSPRGSQALLKAVQVYALLQGRTYVIPDDIKRIAKPVLGHRIVLAGRIGVKQGEVDGVLNDILRQVPVPTESEKELIRE
ncbi:AAA domain-containing protein [Gracilibacillus salitolerans]|uniref:AAA domain-containing protein n=1 Tax=Gracilibacillus salitolerans TaxID=2663022 RepID=A0A5Q2TGV7_9BACI|nr:MoxR family ATPase [Gracilibacillus salitolerans]QGH34074.1 AAA domain-containing protein [Gracilibacillus salitolerans]